MRQNDPLYKVLDREYGGLPHMSVWPGQQCAVQESVNPGQAAIFMDNFLHHRKRAIHFLMPYLLELERTNIRKIREMDPSDNSAARYNSHDITTWVAYVKGEIGPWPLTMIRPDGHRVDSFDGTVSPVEVSEQTRSQAALAVVQQEEEESRRQREFRRSNDVPAEAAADDEAREGEIFDGGHEGQVVGVGGR